MAKSPCAVFWDIQNIGVPKGQSAASIVSLIRSSIINLYNLREIYFYCVCDVTKLPANVGNPLTNQDVNIIQAYDYTKDSADIKILDLMRKFVENQGRSGCAIILLSGDGDYVGTLIDLKKLYNITIFLIRLANSFSSKLEAAANYAFKLTTKGQLQPIKSVCTPRFLVSFSRFPLSRGLDTIKSELNGLTHIYGSIEKSAIVHENEIIIGFPSLELARRAATHFNAARYYGTFLKADVLMDPPSEIIIKVQNACSSAPNSKPKQSQSPANKVNHQCHVLPDNQTLTFIKVSQLTDLLTEEELTHHFAKLTIPFDSKYVKFHESSIWIAFSSTNQAQEALNKLKSSLLLGKSTLAVITSPPVDLLSSSVRQELTVSLERSTSPITRPKQNPTSAPSSPRTEIQSQSKSVISGDAQKPILNGGSCDSEQLCPQNSDFRLAELQGLKQPFALDPPSTHGQLAPKQPQLKQSVNAKWLQFDKFRYQFVCLKGAPNSEFTTVWSLMHHIVAQTIDHRLYKIILEGGDFWLYFDNSNHCKQVIKKINKDENFLKPLKLKKGISPSKRLVNIMSSYHPDSPWCFNPNLGLNFLKSTCSDPKAEANLLATARSLVDIVKSISNEFKCVFVKFFEGTVWAGFPSTRTCEKAKKRINSLIVKPVHMQSVHPRALPAKFFESIGTSDLVGEALVLSKRWFDTRNALPNHSTSSSDKSDLLNQTASITTSISFDSDTDSNSVSSDHFNADRFPNGKPCSSDEDNGNPPTSIDMVNQIPSSSVSCGLGVYLTIGDVHQLSRGLWKKQIVQTFVDFVDIPPRSACLDSNVVHFHYNTIEEAERAKKVVESKLFENLVQFKASISYVEPRSWSVKQKYYFSLPRTVPVPARKLITYVTISPILKKDSRSWNNSLLAALQPFYVYFIRFFEDALWIGIGTLEQSEAAITAIREQKAIGDALSVTINRKLPKHFWKTIKGESKSTNDLNNLPTSKASSVSGSTNKLNITITEVAPCKVSTSVIPQKESAAVLQSTLKQNGIQQSTDKLKSNPPALILPSNHSGVSVPTTFMTSESVKYSKSPSISSSSSTLNPGLQYGNRDIYPTDPFFFTSKSDNTTNTTNYSTTITSSTNLNNDTSSNDIRSLSEEISRILTDPSTSYLKITSYPLTTTTIETLFYLRMKLKEHGSLFVTKLPDYIFAGFPNSIQRNKALTGIACSSFTDMFGHNYTFLTHLVHKPPLKELLLVFKTSDLTLSSDYFTSLNPGKSSTSYPSSLSSSYASNNATGPTIPTIYHPLMSSPTSTSKSAYQLGQSTSTKSIKAPNGNLEDSSSSKKTQKKSKPGGCYLS